MHFRGFGLELSQGDIGGERDYLLLYMGGLVSEGEAWVLSDQGAGGDKSEGGEKIDSVARTCFSGGRGGSEESVVG